MTYFVVIAITPIFHCSNYYTKSRIIVEFKSIYFILLHLLKFRIGGQVRRKSRPCVAAPASHIKNGREFLTGRRNGLRRKSKFRAAVRAVAQLYDNLFQYFTVINTRLIYAKACSQVRRARLKYSGGR